MAVVATAVTAASANWSGPFAVSDPSTDAYGYFTQSVGPDGSATVAWVRWSTGGDPQTVESRELDANGSLEPIRRLSNPDPSAFGTYVSGLDLAHGANGDATATWLEIALIGSSCVTYGYGYSFGGEGDCVVHYYVRTRQVHSDALGPIRTLGESEYSPGVLADSTFLSSPQVVVDEDGAATVAWTSTTASAGCNNYYGYGYEYGGPSECTADTVIQARGIGGAGVPNPTTIPVFESHSVGSYGRSELGDLVVAPSGTVTVSWLKAPSLDFYYCAGGQDVAVETRQIDAGGAGPIQTVDDGDGEGECGWTAPRADVSPGGAVTLVWGRPGSVVSARIAANGVPGAVQELDQAAVFSSPDVAVGPDAAATAVWSDGSDVRSRRIASSGALGTTRVLDTAPTGNDYFYNPQVAVAGDGSTGVAWSWQRWTFEVRLGVKAVRIDAGGTPAPAQVLAASTPDRYFFREMPQVSGGGASTLLSAWLAPAPGVDSWHLPNSQVEASLFTPSPPPGPAPPPAAPSVVGAAPPRGVAIPTRIVPVRDGKALVTLRCPDGGACAGAISLVVEQSAKANSKRAHRSKASGADTVIGSSPFEVPAGGKKTVGIKLTRKGKALVNAAGAAGLKADLRGSGVKSRAVTLKQPGVDEHKRKPRR